MWIHVIFVLICFLLDGLLMSLFPNAMDASQLLFVSNLGFCAVVLTIRKFSAMNAYLFAIASGLFYDYAFANSFLVYAFSFCFIAFVIHLWSKHMMDTMFESLILCISTIFVKDFVVYCVMFFSRSTTISIQEWFIYHEFLTILVNFVLALVLIGAIKYKDEILENKERQVRKKERVEWFKLKSKR